MAQGLATGSTDGNGGNGAQAIASASGSSSGGGAVQVSVTQTGGNGGSGQGLTGVGGTGADSILNNAASGSTTGSLSLSQSAIGGAGGGANLGATAGQAGIGSSTHTVSNSVASSAWLDKLGNRRRCRHGINRQQHQSGQALQRSGCRHLGAPNSVVLNCLPMQRGALVERLSIRRLASLPVRLLPRLPALRRTGQASYPLSTPVASCHGQDEAAR